MKNFIDFVVDAAKDNGLGEEFHTLIQKSDNAALSAWFKTKGYDVSEDECKKMAENKEDIKMSKLGIFNY